MVFVNKSSSATEKRCLKYKKKEELHPHNYKRELKRPSTSTALLHFKNVFSFRRNGAFTIYFWESFLCKHLFWAWKCKTWTLLRPHYIRISNTAEPRAVHLLEAKVNLNLHCFIPFSGKLGNSHLLLVFTNSFTCNTFKGGSIKMPSKT